MVSEEFDCGVGCEKKEGGDDWQLEQREVHVKKTFCIIAYGRPDADIGYSDPACAGERETLEEFGDGRTY